MLPWEYIRSLGQTIDHAAQDKQWLALILGPERFPERGTLGKNQKTEKYKPNRI
jgi:hypothetical protein